MKNQNLTYNPIPYENYENHNLFLYIDHKLLNTAKFVLFFMLLLSFLTRSFERGQRHGHLH